MNAEAKNGGAADLAGSNGEQAALHNRGVVLRAIHRGAPISRTEIARQSGLTKQAIARIAEKLIDEGLVMEARRRQGLRGQPAIELEINPSGCFSVGANIDRDHLTIVAMDATGAVRGRVHHESRFMLPDQFVRLMKEALAGFRHKKIIDETRFAGIGIAIPDWLGEVPVIGFPEAYHAWTDFDIPEALSKLTRHPVFIDNDANAAAAGELQFGLGRESRTFFYILASACLGGGLVLDGQQHGGVAKMGGEIGWLPTGLGPGSAGVQPLGKIVSLFILYEFLRQHGVEASEPKHLLALDSHGKALVTQWLRQVSVHIAEAVMHIGLIIDPDAILIGGRFPVRLIDELLL
ncbi:MAG: ROK family transcriptional regulator, partial [Rhizobiaceae bacterium]|nr:ROK family transcriptional regulator [Rhizobiaceae bacterium]